MKGRISPKLKSLLDKKEKLVTLPASELATLQEENRVLREALGEVQKDVARAAVNNVVWPSTQRMIADALAKRPSNPCTRCNGPMDTQDDEQAERIAALTEALEIADDALRDVMNAPGGACDVFGDHARRRIADVLDALQGETGSGK